MSLDTYALRVHASPRTSRELRQFLKGFGCVEVRQKGSHLVVKCGKCTTVIPVHAGEDLGAGLLRAIERQLSPCLGPDWLKHGKQIAKRKRSSEEL